MALSEEEAKRLQALDDDRQRLINDRSRRAALAGDPAAKAEFDSRWQPLVAWMKEHG